MTDRTISVLLIEDDMRYATLLSDMLGSARDTHFSVTHEMSLAEAVQQVTRGKFDMILSDLSLPDSQGLDTFKHVYARVNHIPIIILTGMDDEGMAIEALRRGAQDYLIKGHFDRALLTRSIRYAIERQGMQNKLAELAVLEERRRLARELHDSVSQTLFSAGVIAETLPYILEKDPVETKKALVELANLTKSARSEMRELLTALRPPALVESYLSDLFRDLAKSYGERSGVRIEVQCEGRYQLPSEVQLMIYRIGQEALNNIVKHAKATVAQVTLRYNQESVDLTIRDDGCGFDPQGVPTGHLGLKIMRERAQVIGALVKLNSRPGQGTDITVTWRATGASEVTKNG